MRRFLRWMLGGRPMSLIVDHPGFYDFIDNRPVFFWRDSYDRVWMANSAWSWFRVARP